MKSPRESHIVIVGAARNVERTIARQVSIFERVFASFEKVSYIIVESDSSDRTLEILEKLKARIQNFHFLSLGKLQAKLPIRTQRIAKARNSGLEFCQESPSLAKADYIAVADLDGVNLQLTDDAVLSCWNCGEWDVATSNQPEGYYDVWALRHPNWCPGDCWEEFRRLTKYFGEDVAHQVAISSKRIRIPRTHGVIDVESAFGGLAIYRAQVFFKSSYKITKDGEDEVCEHVPFHKEMKARGARIIINPSLVNTRSHQDSLPLLSAERLTHIVRRLAMRGR